MQQLTVSKRIRLVGFLIDLAIYTFITSILLTSLKTNTELIGNKLAERIFSLAFYWLYYLIFELLLRKTPGKLVTCSKVVSTANQSSSPGSIIIRSFIRIIPLDPLSIFFTTNNLCWHDSLSKTQVVKISKSN